MAQKDYRQFQQDYVPEETGENQCVDSNGTPLETGDAVHLIKDLNVKGSSLNLKQGTVIKKIYLTDEPAEVECKIGKSTIVLKTCFLKKKSKG